jgi:hypothetical protein
VVFNAKPAGLRLTGNEENLGRKLENQWRARQGYDILTTYPTGYGNRPVKDADDYVKKNPYLYTK